MPKENLVSIVTEARESKEQKLSIESQFASEIFSYEVLEKTERLYIKNLSGAGKEDIKWQAREIQISDMSDYKKLLSDVEVMKYYHQETTWSKSRIETEVENWVNSYNNGHPLLPSALTILDKKNNNFVGYISIFKIEEEGIAKMGYAFLPKYWNKGIRQSVLKKFVEEWSHEVRKIGLGIGLDKNNSQHQKIKEKFRCVKGKELQYIYATVRPINISSLSILEKNGFKTVKRRVENIDNPINFNVKEFDLSFTDNLFDYCEKVEYYIEKLYKDKEIKADKLYRMIKNDKLYTFSRESQKRIRFHYEREIN